MSRWKKLNTEQIAISTVTESIESRVNRVAITTEIETRTKLQQELGALSYMKRKAPTSDYNNDPDPKQRKQMSVPIKCAHCGRLGHHVSACRFRKDNRSTGASPEEANKLANTSKPATTDITCFNYRGTGHYASRCLRAVSIEAKSTAVSTTSKPEEGLVEVCAVSASNGSSRTLR
ncbi:hypothetical protein PYW07_006728 [Mythimna separata]|uniref:CCHC-type domain-containing protein n=1 Tax=Mythimna separata TaxID=271217 RepID=A0AAD8DWR8_MYTSE|nr:hypothetical protein PYW07_006728 [Mythimna separata]